MADTETMDPWKEAEKIRSYSPRPEKELAYNSLVFLQVGLKQAGFQVTELDLGILGKRGEEAGERLQKISALIADAMKSVGKVIDFLDDENEKTGVDR